MLVLILPRKDGNFSGKEGHTDIQPSTKPGIEPWTFGLGDTDRTTAPTPPHEARQPERELLCSMQINWKQSLGSLAMFISSLTENMVFSVTSLNVVSNRA